MVLVRLFQTNKKRDHVQARVVVLGTGQAVPDQKEQRLGKRVVIHGTGQAVPDQLEQR